MAQQVINVGTVANDRTGDPWRESFIKSNDNFTELYKFVDENVIHIDEISDFPNEPDGNGFIEIGGGTTTYIIAAAGVDITPFKLRQTGGIVVIKGASRFSSTLTSDTTSPLITIIDGSYADEFLGITNPNGAAYSFDGTNLFRAVFVTQNSIIRECTRLGTIKNAFTVSLRTVTVVATSVGGFTFEGTDLLQLNISDYLGFSWTGTLIDLGTSTWDIINIASGNRFISPAGTITLSGLAASGNLTTNGRGIVIANLFNGDGTAVDGIDTNDLKWSFQNNIFTDGTTINSRILSDSFLIGSETVTIVTSGVFVAVSGTNWSSDISDRFTVTAAGLFTYIALNTSDIKCSAFSTVEKVGGGADKICSEIAINGVVQAKSIGCTQNATPTQITSVGIFTLSTGDTVQLFVANQDSTSNVIMSESTMVLGSS